MGSKQSMQDSLKFIQGNMQKLLKVQTQSDPEIETLKN